MVYRDPTPLDPNKDYTAEELAKFILEKMYGKHTREAMARSLLKANEVAEWAREVAQQLIDGSFDEGALNTAIEQKLNDLEQEYAPQLSTIKNEVEDARGSESTLGDRLGEVDSQLAQNATELSNTTQAHYRNGDNNTIVTFIDDDATQQFVDRLKPIFDSEGVSCTLAVNPGELGKQTTNALRLGLDDLLSLQQEGYEIVSHGHNHMNMSVDQADVDLEYELWESKKFLMKNGFKGHKYLVYPNGVRPTDYRTQGFVRKYYECGIAIGSGSINTTPINQFNMLRYGLSGTFENLKSRIENAKNEWIIFISHAWQDIYAETQQRDDIQQFIQYIKSKNIDIVTVEEGLNRFGNIIDYQPSSDKYLRISKTGQVEGNDIKQDGSTGLYYLSPGNNEDIEQPITFYEPNSVTFRHYATNLSNAPIPNKPGVCATHRAPTSDLYSYQVWTDLGSGQEFYRYWHTEGYWRVWQQKEKLNMDGTVVDAQIDKPGSDFPEGVTFRAHPGNQTASAPEPNTVGVSKTVRAHSSEVYIYQEWTSYTNKKYVRWWSSSNKNWLSWTEI